MKENSRIIWIIDGKIIDYDKFRAVVDRAIETASEEAGTQSYWWSMTCNATRFNDIDIYTTPQAALAHIMHWARYNDEFAECAQNQRLLLLGDAPNDVREALQAFNPHFMGFYGGFAKERSSTTSTSNEAEQKDDVFRDKPQGEVGMQCDIFWSMEGKITNRVQFRECMERITSASESEQDTVMHWWCCDNDDMFFILEHYASSDAAVAHLAAHEAHLKAFLGATEMTNFSVYSNTSSELSEVIAGLNPEHLRFVGGFTR